MPLARWEHVMQQDALRLRFLRRRPDLRWDAMARARPILVRPSTVLNQQIRARGDLQQRIAWLRVAAHRYETTVDRHPVAVRCNAVLHCAGDERIAAAN